VRSVGAGRIQILASNGILTAADIDDFRIRSIKGFGAVLTSNLLAWKQEVHRQFCFDPATAVSPTEQQPITVKSRNAQQRLLAELARQIVHLESLPPACRAALHKLIPELQRAVAQYEQAEADLHLLNGKR
jgi:DNA-binding helix-hairpin-helix protein with protein kinase domain